MYELNCIKMKLIVTHRAAACAVSNPPTQIYPDKTISSVTPSNFLILYTTCLPPKSISIIKKLTNPFIHLPKYTCFPQSLHNKHNQKQYSNSIFHLYIQDCEEIIH